MVRRRIEQIKQACTRLIAKAGVPISAGPPLAARIFSAGDIVVLIIASGALAAFAVNRFSPTFLDADTVLFSIISLQKVTLFYWGQNRLIDIWPWMLSWITSPQANLAAHLEIISFGFFALLCIIGLAGTALLFPRASRRDRWTATLMLIAVTLAVLQPYAANTFISEGQPYATSYALAILAALLLARHSKLIAVIAGLALLCIATGLNPSVILPTLLISCFMALSGDWRGALLLGATTLAWTGMWAEFAEFAPKYPVPYTSFLPTRLNMAIAESVRHMALALRLSVVAALWAALAALSCWSPRHPDGRLSRAILAAVVMFALIWTVGFSGNSWVQTNGSPFRYFFPVIMIAPIFLTVGILRLLFSWPRWIRDCGAGLAIIFLLAYLVRPPVAFADYAAFTTVEPVVDYARANDVRFIGGRYWLVWPAVFLLQDRPGEVFGLASRARIDHLRLALDAELHAHGVAKVICLGGETDRAQCLADTKFYINRPWNVAPDVCPGACSVIETRRTAQDG